MSREVDDRIVSMKFDNATFEKKMQETLKGLMKLRDMDFKGATSGLQGVGEAAKKFDAGNMAESVDGVSNKFLALATIGITALARLTNAAIDAGSRIVRALAIDPITQGFGEFELKMGSIQTIMAGSGESLEEVNRQLNELNYYADRTIYSFSDMTTNIGKFTNAGVSLEDSVAAIQGVANVAALSGANSNEASRAMYNFAQALSTGSVKLIDWKSIELANMGTVEFKEQIIDTALAMGTLTRSADGTIRTLEGTEVTTSNFNSTLQDAWFTSDVLTEVLGRFSDETTDIGRRAAAAATEIKTFSQMVDTMKESVGSGWAMTFEHIFGDFEEGKQLWTSINDAFEATIGAASEARNELLLGWKELGGRDKLIEGFTNAAQGLASILTPIKDAFRDIFPPMTAQRLYDLTARFADFTKQIKIGEETASKIRRTFSGLFSIFKIGFEVVKGLFRVFADVVGELTGVGSGMLSASASAGDFLTNLQEMLVAGGGIQRFFERFSEVIRNPIRFLRELKDNIVELFSSGEGIPGAAGAASVLERLGERFEGVRNFAERLAGAFRWLEEATQGIRTALGAVWDVLSEWFSELGDRFANIMQPGDFDGAVDAINVGLLGGIALLIRRFMNEGFGGFAFGSGIVENITEAFGELTGVLSAMQAEIKANALLKIAAAVGILTVSVIALSLIDSASLTKALTALAVGFGQLIGVMTALDKLSFTTSGLKLASMATGLILIAGAAVVLSIAVRNLSGLDWDELAKGLIGVTVMLAAMAAATRIMSKDLSGMVRAGIGMMGISVALLILSTAVKSFGEMDWDEMGKGLLGVSVGLGVLTLATRHMPTDMVGKGIGLIALSAGLLILAEAVESFAEMDWQTMGKGFLGVAGGLVTVGLAMRLMPKNMLAQAAALVVVGAALHVISRAVADMGSLSLEEMAKGIGGIATMLLALSLGLNLMNGTLPGAAAMVVAAGALMIFAQVLKEIGGLSIQELIVGLGGIAAVFLVLGLGTKFITPLIPAMFALGKAMLLLGAAFALFGVGAILVAKAFEIVAKAGEAGIKVLIRIIEEIVKAIPGFIAAVAVGIMQAAEEILNAAPTVLRAVEAILGQLLQTVVRLTPEIARTLSVIITEFLRLVREKTPEVIETGISILLALLTGVRDNIGEIVTLVADIVTNFLDALADKVPEIIDSVFNLLVAVIEGVVSKLFSLVGALLPFGGGLIGGLLEGIANKALEVTSWFLGLPSRIVGWLGNVAGTLVSKGIDIITGFFSGITQKFREVTGWLGGVRDRALSAVGNVARTLFNKGKDVIESLRLGFISAWSAARSWITGIPGRITTSIGDLGRVLINAGRDVMNGFWRGLRDIWEDVKGWLRGLTSWIPDWKGPPERDRVLLFENGMLVMQGFWKGLSSVWDDVEVWLKNINPAENVDAKRIGTSLQKAFAAVEMHLGDIEPTITPVLDMSKVEADAKNLSKFMKVSSLDASVSLNRAKDISSSINARHNEPTQPAASELGEVKFEQNIYAPKQLSTGDIYRSTKSQIALAKEELGLK